MNTMQRGKAFEYALVKAFAKSIPTLKIDELTLEVAKRCFGECDDRQSMFQAGLEASALLCAFDNNVAESVSIRAQTDHAGQSGDVRDLILTTPMGEIGLSAKTNHEALKSSRLSHKIDFGKRWADCPVSRYYWEAIAPVFALLTELKQQGKKFSDIDNKESAVYLPVIIAFEDEMRRLCELYGEQFIRRVFLYLTGQHDFYKIIRRKKTGYVTIQSFNPKGMLKGESKWKIPKRIEHISRPLGSNNTILVNFQGGWQISFRIHNATTKVEPSLKFDVKFIGTPNYVTLTNIPPTPYI